jgi:triphosphoribosyl-dephospho-CoA synthase
MAVTDDMDYATFMRSLHALRPYFPAIAACGSERPDFAPLRQLGIDAEAAMLLATGGVNTHRGAIFNLGLLSAAAGCLLAEGDEPSATAICQLVREQWGEAILSGLSGVTDDAGLSHGLAVAQRYGAGGARREAAAGFPAAIEIGLPAYRAALLATGDAELAATQTLFALIAELEDTNLLWRAGPAGLAHARRSAGDFLAAGGVLATDWQQQAAAIDRRLQHPSPQPRRQRRPARRDAVSRRTRRIALAMRLALLFSGQGGQRPEHGQQIGAELRRVALADAARHR